VFTNEENICFMLMPYVCIKLYCLRQLTDNQKNRQRNQSVQKLNPLIYRQKNRKAQREKLWLSITPQREVQKMSPDILQMLPEQICLH